MCKWCPEGYWECDGEGGECGGAGGDGGRRDPDAGTGWKCVDWHYLLDKNLNPVLDSNHDRIKIAIDGSVDDNGDLIVKLNGCDVVQDNDNKPPKVPHADRNRAWKINTVVALQREDCGDEVKGESGATVRVRVQAYKYDFDKQYHKSPPHHTGTGPKIRVHHVSG